jgi:hypothetical protein
MGAQKKNKDEHGTQPIQYRKIYRCPYDLLPFGPDKNKANATLVGNVNVLSRLGQKLSHWFRFIVLEAFHLDDAHLITLGVFPSRNII